MANALSEPTPANLEADERAPHSRDFASTSNREDTIRQPQRKDTNSSKRHGVGAYSAKFRQKSARRAMTDLEQPAAEGPVQHKYLFRRPRALLWAEDSHVVELGHEDQSKERLNSNGNGVTNGEGLSRETSLPEDAQRRDHANINLQRRRIDLFVDLIFVGIIANTSDLYAELLLSPETSSNEALVILIAAFMTTWRIWNYIRDFLNTFYMDDLLQRVFLSFLMICSLFYGNFLAYLSKDPNKYKNTLIILYLIVRGSVVLMEAFYSIWIHWLRPVVLVSFLLFLPGLAFWIGAINTENTTALGLVFGGAFYDYLASIILLSPLAERMFSSNITKALDTEHFIERMEGFYLIVLGEGVFLLIKGGPLGNSVSGVAANCVWAFLIYSLLAYLYFNSDSSRTYIHALKRAWWRRLLWSTFHILLFANLIIVSACIVYLITGQAGSYKSDAAPSYSNEEEHTELDQRAIWSMAGSLGLVMFSLLVLALLNRSMDKPGTLKVNNRYIRMAPRAMFIVIICTVPLSHKGSAQQFLGLTSLLLYVLSLWEWIVSLEKGGGWFEPKHESGRV